MKEEQLILVDRDDNPIGTMGKLEVHEKGILHRAFSVFVVNQKKELLLQQRAKSKYHSPGLWTNTCCSHQREGETSLEAGKRRLNEEMGMEVALEELFTFIYKAPFDNGLTEHELDHVMLGYSETPPIINRDEVEDWKWESLHTVNENIKNHPEDYTAWFKIIFDRFYNYILSN